MFPQPTPTPGGDVWDLYLNAQWGPCGSMLKWLASSDTPEVLPGCICQLNGGMYEIHRKVWLRHPNNGLIQIGILHILRKYKIFRNRFSSYSRDMRLDKRLYASKTRLYVPASGGKIGLRPISYTPTSLSGAIDDHWLHSWMKPLMIIDHNNLAWNRLLAIIDYNLEWNHWWSLRTVLNGTIDDRGLESWMESVIIPSGSWWYAC